MSGYLPAAIMSLCWLQTGQTTKSTSPENKIRREALKGVLKNLEYAPKDLGNNVFQIEIERPDETVQVTVSMSASMSKIWLTCGLGALRTEDKGDSEWLLSLLEKNGEIQPTHFYARKGKLNLGLPIDNRVATNAVLKKEIEGFADIVIKIKPIWNRGA